MAAQLLVSRRFVRESIGRDHERPPNGVVKARVLFDGTHGFQVNTRTRTRGLQGTNSESVNEERMLESFGLATSVALESAFVLPTSKAHSPRVLLLTARRLLMMMMMSTGFGLWLLGQGI